MMDDPEQPEWFNKIMRNQETQERASGSLQPAGSALATTDTGMVNYIEWTEKMKMHDAQNVTDFLVLARDGTTCWGATYRDAVRAAMAHDFPAVVTSCGLMPNTEIRHGGTEA